MNRTDYCKNRKTKFIWNWSYVMPFVFLCPIYSEYENRRLGWM